MSYDFHGSWDNFLGFNAPLYGNDHEQTVDSAVKYWISNGASADKINLGMGTYGRSFTLADPSATKPNSGASGAGQAGRVNL